jgi:hypothetical protein
LEEKRNAYRILVGKLEGKILLGNQNVGVDNIKIDLTAIEWGGMNSVDLAQDRDQ